MRYLKLFIITSLIGLSLSLSAKDYSASVFGILSNGTTLNTRSIQRAIDKISEEGGGTLIFSVGRYLTGSVHLKSGVIVELREGAILVGSTNPHDYDSYDGNMALVMAKGAENIAIVGRGVIEGQGRELADNFLAQVANGTIENRLDGGRVSNRPHLIYFRECSNVRIMGITLKDPASWTQNYDRCRNLLVERITVNSRAYWNNDGLNIVDCDGVVLRGNYINASDDGIVLKSHTSEAMVKNVLIRDNVITSSASAIKFGTAGRGGFRDIKVLNNRVYDTFRSAIAIESVDGGWTGNIEVDSLYATNVGNAIFLRVGERVEGKRSHMENVSIRNVTCEVAAGKADLGVEFEGPTNEDYPRNVSPCAIVGLPDSRIVNVTLENVEVRHPGGGDPAFAKVGTDELDKVPELPRGYPEFSKFKELPAWGLYVRHAEGVVLKNVSLSADRPDYRVPVVTDDVTGFKVEGLDCRVEGRPVRRPVFSRNTTK